MAKCELCEEKKITKWHFENRDWLIMNCKTCKNPMIVYRHHTMTAPINQILFILNKARQLFGEYKLRALQRKIKGHLHWHIE